MKIPHIKKMVKKSVVTPLQIGTQVKITEGAGYEVELGKVIAVGYRKNSVTYIIDTETSTITMHFSSPCKGTLIDGFVCPYSLNAESYSKDDGTLNVIDMIHIINARPSKVGITAKSPNSKQNAWSAVSPITPFTSGEAKTFFLGYSDATTTEEFAPMVVGDTFKSKAGVRGKQYQVDWIAPDGAMVVHRIDPLSTVEIEKRKNEASRLSVMNIKPDLDRKYESILVRATDRSFLDSAIDVEYR